MDIKGMSYKDLYWAMGVALTKVERTEQRLNAIRHTLDAQRKAHSLIQAEVTRRLMAGELA